MFDRYVKECPYCGGKETVEASVMNAMASSVATGLLKTAKLYYAICTSCGSVVRAYVREDAVKKLL